MTSVRDLSKLARKNGWTTRLTRKGHTQFVNPEGRVVAVASGSASDHRSIKNTVAHLRAAGLPVPRRDGRTN